MNERDEQLERFGEAVEKKKQDSKEASEQTLQEPPGDAGAVAGDQRSLHERGRTQDVFDPRDKNSGKGKKTADKWNQ